MNLSIPSSGFCVMADKDLNLFEIKNTFELNNAETLHFKEDHILMAVWKQNSEQGLWSDGKNVVSHDVVLTNQEHLVGLVEIQNTGSIDSGRLIWLLYKKYGIDFIDKLRGTFAFAIWDGTCKELFVITDPYGIKPIVYSKNNNNFCAASRISHLLWADPSLKDINPDAIFHYLFFQAVCSPLTIYKEISKLEPGKGLHKKERLTQFTHYDIRYSPNRSISENEWKQQIKDQVEKAVNVFVPLSPYEKTGCFLSGGTDSSSITGFYTQLSGKPAKTFSIGFAEPKYNELEYARIAAEKFKTDYHEYYVTPRDVMALIEHLPAIYDEPFGNASVIPAFYCAHHAAEKGIDIMLGGDGGDEIFGGNERYVTNLVFQKYLGLPSLIRQKCFEPMLALMPDKGLFYKAKRYIRRANIPNPDRFFSYNLLAEINPERIFQPDFIDSVNLSSFMQIAKKHYQNAAPADDTDRLMYLDMKFTITDNDIRKVTQMAEAAGIRVRYPLLDRDLVDFSATIPPQLKVKPGKNRYIFKRAMQGFLPTEIISKSKHGMGLPIAVWFKEDPVLSQFVGDLLFSGKPRILEYIKPSFLEFLRSSFKEDKTSYYGDILWVYLMLELWLRKK